MADPHLVIDFELHFRGAREPVSFTMDEGHGDTMVPVKGSDERRYVLVLADGREQVHLVKWGDVQYARLTQRFEEEPPPVYLEGGIRISGETPTLD